MLTDWNASLPRRVQAMLNTDAARAEWKLLVASAQAGNSADGWFGVDDVHTELAGAMVPAAIERSLRSFVGPASLLDLHDIDGELRFRFRYPGVASLLLTSAAMARLEG